MHGENMKLEDVFVATTK